MKRENAACRAAQIIAGKNSAIYSASSRTSFRKSNSIYLENFNSIFRIIGWRSSVGQYLLCELIYFFFIFFLFFILSFSSRFDWVMRCSLRMFDIQRYLFNVTNGNASNERGLLTSSKQSFFFLMELLSRTRNSIFLIHTHAHIAQRSTATTNNKRLEVSRDYEETLNFKQLSGPFSFSSPFICFVSTFGTQNFYKLWVKSDPSDNNSFKFFETRLF